VTRLEAWNQAEKLVKPILIEYELKQYSPGANIFSTGISVTTPASQCINHIIDVAEWLLKEE
jgi:hypothetical protein